MPTEIAARLISAMSADEQADLFREIQPACAHGYLALARSGRRARRLEFLLGFPPDTAGGISDDSSSWRCPGDRTVEQVLAHLGRGGAHEGDDLLVYVVSADGRLEYRRAAARAAHGAARRAHQRGRNRNVV
jgi:Mg/Co/Ni transporter MgtE